MKRKAANLKPSTMTLALRLSVMSLIIATGTALAQEFVNNHEYSADGETTIETIDGLRVITLRENVFVRQGDIKLSGDIAVLEYNQDKQLQQVRLNGAPAHFEQKPQDQSDIITGHSETINYYAGTEGIVEFIGDANFTQPGTSLRCAQIRHTIATGATTGQACSGSLNPPSN